jgi:hypothetical protein
LEINAICDERSLGGIQPLDGENGPIGIDDEAAFPTAEALAPPEGSLRQGLAIRAEAQQIVQGALNVVFVEGHPVRE